MSDPRMAWRPRTSTGVPRTGMALEFGIALRNGSDRLVTVEFATGQRYDFSLESEDGEEHWRWS